MSAKANPNKIVISEYLDAPGQTLTWSGKQVEVVKGARCAGLVVIDGTLKLSGELDVAHVAVANPTGGDGCSRQRPLPVRRDRPGRHASRRSACNATTARSAAARTTSTC